MENIYIRINNIIKFINPSAEKEKEEMPHAFRSPAHALQECRSGPDCRLWTRSFLFFSTFLFCFLFYFLFYFYFYFSCREPREIQNITDIAHCQTHHRTPNHSSKPRRASSASRRRWTPRATSTCRCVWTRWLGLHGLSSSTAIVGKTIETRIRLSCRLIRGCLLMNLSTVRDVWRRRQRVAIVSFKKIFFFRYWIPLEYTRRIFKRANLQL
jgi:hypothetical protein